MKNDGGECNYRHKLKYLWKKVTSIIAELKVKEKRFLTERNKELILNRKKDKTNERKVGTLEGEEMCAPY